MICRMTTRRVEKIFPSLEVVAVVAGGLGALFALVTPQRLLVVRISVLASPRMLPCANWISYWCKLLGGISELFNPPFPQEPPLPRDPVLLQCQLVSRTPSETTVFWLVTGRY